MTLVARQREHCRFFLVIFLVVQLSPKRGVWVHKNDLASCQRCCHSIEPRALTCPFKHSDLIARLRLSWHPTHKFLWGRLYFVQACCVLFIVTFSQQRLGLCQRKCFSQKQFRLKSTPKCTCTIFYFAERMRARQSRYETVGDGSSSHWIV